MAVPDDAAWRDLIRDSSIQFSFPPLAPAPAPPNWLARLAAFLASHGQVLRMGIWVVLGAGLLVALFLLIRHWRSRMSEGGTASVPVPAWQPSPERARLVLADADALASAGRFSEAAHLLLRIAVEEISRRRPGALTPAFTAREITRLEALSPRARGVFALIATVVEHSLFGGGTVAEPDFARCRAAFASFLEPQAWSAA